ncbi:hypothetical protein VTK26DRAFT_3254 [Humicola hyalothermophila]
MAQIRVFCLVVLAALATLASASVPTFCKCTCFQNSTIIPLGPQHDQPAPPPPAPPKDPSPSASSLPPSSSSSGSGSDQEPVSPNGSRRRNNDDHHPFLNARAASSSCAQCNRAFCLKYNLPICKDAEEKDVVTSCFQRDSRKDQVIVWGFILGTAGLLGWAGIRRAVFSGAQTGGGQARQGQGQAHGQGRGSGRGAGGRGVGGGGELGGGSVGRGGGGILGAFVGFVGGGGSDGGRGQGLWRRGSSGVDRGAYSPLEGEHGGQALRGTG